MRGFFICGGIFDLSTKEQELQQLEQVALEDAFWEDQGRAKQVIAKINVLKSWTVPYAELKRRIEDVKAFLPDAGQDAVFSNELLVELAKIETGVEELELRKMLSHEADSANCFLSVNAGAGGTEACDWALMLLRMYERWALKRGWTVEMVDALDGDVAGVRSATIRIVGQYAYGYAKAEKGVHRLVRISPFDSNARRHTSFAAVDVVPEISDDVEVEIRTEDLRIDTYRASGAGGQHVNKTDSAVRMTHIPTGVVVSSQSQRSQTQNKEYCFKLLRSKLYELKLDERKKQMEAMAGDKKEIGWGSQIRSYVFQPYTLVKDNRTKVEVGSVQSVMDGDIDIFINAYLKERSGV